MTSFPFSLTSDVQLAVRMNSSVPFLTSVCRSRPGVTKKSTTVEIGPMRKAAVSGND